MAEPVCECGHPYLEHSPSNRDHWCLWEEANEEDEGGTGVCDCMVFRQVPEFDPANPDPLNCATCGHTPQNHRFITDRFQICIWNSEDGCKCLKFQVVPQYELAVSETAP